ncbi:glycosyl hydrolase family 8 [Acidisphaera sp. L21]|uniref:glycosyl hydrolase family 8 n=1 Tax=Acidisphaera sp. L21 TaxID=1641851 RepID=UPI001C2083EC|nr:glycosyl hydrolase family 8 [Acidisphaera sp. L21]
MIFQNTIAAIDHASRPAEATAPQRNTGRRFVLGAALGGAALIAGARFGMLPAKPVPATAAPALPTEADLGSNSVSATLATHVELVDWKAFRARFIRPDGRVIDTFNQGESHTESQGLGMLFAASFDDRPSFDRIWTWTKATLSRPSDALSAWRYLPGSSNPVPDMNNATDGDIYIAGALLRASARWKSPEYLDAAQKIAGDILRLLVREVGGKTVLLPAADGFVKSDYTVVNLSYYVQPLLAELQEAYPSPLWEALFRDGDQLRQYARFGKWQLPPDWLRVSAANGALSIDSGHPPRFSFDAVRVPLFVAWSRGDPQALQSFVNFWGATPSRAPAWIDLDTGSCAPYPISKGVMAIARLSGCGHQVERQADLPAISGDEPYYSAALILLSRIALREIKPKLV